MNYLKKLLGANSYFAVSAGIDSVACSHFLASKGLIKGIVHSNCKFLLEDDKMEQAAKNLASYLKLPFYFERDCAPYEKGSEEDFCRKKRISFFERWGSKFLLRPTLYVAHHLLDCTESYLFNVIRGNEGYMPIPARTEFVNFTLTRPFLLTEKADIISYAKKNNLEQFVVEDPLNEDESKFRNWARRDILPQISKRINLNTVVKKKVTERLKRDGYL